MQRPSAFVLLTVYDSLVLGCHHVKIYQISECGCCRGNGLDCCLYFQKTLNMSSSVEGVGRMNG